MEEDSQRPNFSHIALLEIQHLRNINYALFKLSEGINLIYGANGAGKTAICEAVSLMFHGKSSRASAAFSEIIQSGEQNLQLKAKIVSCDKKNETRLAMRRGVTDSWSVIRDGKSQSRLQDVTQILPLLILNPEMDNIIDRDPTARRRLFDWLMFHVEHSFTDHAKQYSRALKQRNQLLRVKSRFDDELTAWTDELIRHGDILTQLRHEVMTSIEEFYKSLVNNTLFEGSTLRFFKGWQGADLSKAFASIRNMELRRKVTLHGPHRFDFSFVDDRDRPFKSFLSRGEKKRLSILFSMAMVQLLRQRTKKRVLLIVDDWRAELDEKSRAFVMSVMRDMQCQTIFTTTELQDQQLLIEGDAMFHVEHGTLRDANALST